MKRSRSNWIFLYFVMSLHFMASSTIWTNSHSDGSWGPNWGEDFKLFCKYFKSPARRQELPVPPVCTWTSWKERKTKKKVLPVWLCVCEQVCVCQDRQIWVGGRRKGRCGSGTPPGLNKQGGRWGPTGDMDMTWRTHTHTLQRAGGARCTERHNRAKAPLF